MTYLTDFVVASFYTPDTSYERMAKERLIPSLEKHGVRYDIQPSKSTGDWHTNIYKKPLVIARVLRNNPMANVVWLDADAEMVSHAPMFSENGFDFAPHYREPYNNLSSGTMFFRNTAPVMRLVEHWDVAIHQHRKYGDITEQKVLEECLPAHTIVKGSLPLQYSTIFDGPQPKQPPIIIHHQASRKGRDEIAKTGKQ